MKEIGAGSVDMILADLPYGTTQNKWDSVIPFDELWENYNNIVKKDAATVLTAAQPFTSVLVCSNIKNFKYDWVWQKPKGTGHLNAKKMPMKDKEDILVFCNGKLKYNPQMEKGTPYKNKTGKDVTGNSSMTDNYGSYSNYREENTGYRYPKQVLKFGVVERGNLHPTQKPVLLFEYLIKTYTDENELVLDNVAGSGTTAIAAMNTGRKWICIEKDKDYFDKACERISLREKELGL